MNTGDRIGVALKNAPMAPSEPTWDRYEQITQRASRIRGRRVTVAAAAAVAVVIGGAGVFATMAGARQGVDTANAPAFEQATSIPIEPRISAGFATNAEGSLVFGGQLPEASRSTAAQPTSLPDSAYYDASLRQWRKTAASPLSPRSSAVVVAVDGDRFFVAGGEDRSVVPLRRLHDAAIYDPAANTWQTIPSAPNCPLVGTSIGQLVYTWGTCNGTKSSTFARLDEATTQWDQLSNPPLDNISALGAVGDTIVAASSSGQLAKYLPTQNSWSLESPLPVFQRSTGQAQLFMAPHGNDLLIVAAVTTPNDITGAIYSLDASLEPRPLDPQSAIDWPSAPQAAVAIAGDFIAWTAPSGLYWCDLRAGSFGRDATVAGKTAVISPLLIPLAPGVFGLWAPQSQHDTAVNWAGKVIIP